MTEFQLQLLLRSLRQHQKGRGLSSGSSPHNFFRNDGSSRRQMAKFADFNINYFERDDFSCEPTAVGINDGSQCKIHLNKFGEDATGGT